MTQALTKYDLGSIERCLRGRCRSSSGLRAAPSRTAAVYVLFSMHEGEPSVTLIRRSNFVSQHRGEYAFPGGGVEPQDPSFHDAALREVHEELGVDRNIIEPWGELEPEVTVTSGFLVVPFTGRLADGAALAPAPDEVAEVVRVPLAALAEPANERVISRLTFQPVMAGAVPNGASAGHGDHRPASAADPFELKTYKAYAYNGRVIWGATARILAQVVALTRLEPKGVG